MSENGGDKAEGFGLPEEPVVGKPIDPSDAAPDPKDLDFDVIQPQSKESAPIIRGSERGRVPGNYAKMNGGRGRRGGGIVGGMRKELQEEDKQNRFYHRIFAGCPSTSGLLHSLRKVLRNAPPKQSNHSEDASLAPSFVRTGLGFLTELDSTEGREGACAEPSRGINNGIHKPQAVQGHRLYQERRRVC